MNDAKQLHEEVARLERDKAELARKIEAQRAENERCVAQLKLLGGGIFRKAGRRRLWVGLVIVCVVAGVTGYYVTRSESPPRRRPVVSRPLRPHVLITSEPARARVSFTSNRMPESVARKRRITPFYFDAPPRGARYTITVEAEGYLPRTGTLVVRAQGGVHWHAVLEPRKVAR